MSLTPNDLDVIQVIKQEWPDLGGGSNSGYPYSLPIEPLEDGIEAAALFVVEVGRRNKAVAIWADSGKLRFRDVTNQNTGGQGYTLTELLAGVSGITEGSHPTLRQLIHFINEGPAEGFTSGYREIGDGPFPTYKIWYEDETKVKKIVEKLMTWNGVFKNTNTWKIYDVDGTTVVAQAIDTFDWSLGIFKPKVTRVITEY